MDHLPLTTTITTGRQPASQAADAPATSTGTPTPPSSDTFVRMAEAIKWKLEQEEQAAKQAAEQDAARAGTR